MAARAAVGDRGGAPLPAGQDRLRALRPEGRGGSLVDREVADHEGARGHDRRLVEDARLGGGGKAVFGLLGHGGRRGQLGGGVGPRPPRPLRGPDPRDRRDQPEEAAHLHTNVYDLTDPTSRRLIWSGEGRDKKTLERFFFEIGPDLGKRIRAVCCDMWANYVEVVRSCAAGAAIVFDKFQLVRHLLNAVNDVRKAEAEELQGSDPTLLKGTRYIWLKNPENLTDRQRVRLSELEKMNLKVNRAYLLKEVFRDLWDYQKKGWAKRYLDQWFWWATHSRLAPMREFAWMLRRNEDGILAYFDHRIDNGAVEAMNNNAKAIRHRARGFRSAKAFTLAMLHCLGRLELPEIAHKFS